MIVTGHADARRELCPPWVSRAQAGSCGFHCFLSVSAVRFDPPLRAGGQINSSAGPLLLSVDDAGQRGRGDWRAGKLVATIRFSLVCATGAISMHIMRPFQRMAASGTGSISSPGTPVREGITR